MEVVVNHIDSIVLGGTVVSISDFDADGDFTEFEAQYRAEHNPIYAAVKVPIDDVRSIHALETAGFRFIEAQVRTVFKIKETLDISGLPYEFIEVRREEDLEDVLFIASQTFTDDRFANDPDIGNAKKISGERYALYVRDSFERPTDRVYRLVSTENGMTVAFKTHRYVAPDEALMLLGGVHPDYKGSGIAPIASNYEFRAMRGDGIKRMTTHVSARNYAIMNLEIGGFKFRIAQVFAVLRKLY